MSNEIGWFLVAALLGVFEPGLKGLQDCLDFNGLRKVQGGFENSKHEIRNTKQIRITKFSNVQNATVPFCFEFLSFEF
ncbi:hypothetical protein ACX8XN_03175 [Calditrichota bacterium GD2]